MRGNDYNDGTIALSNSMSKPAAATVISCQLHIGGFCAVLATLLLLPSATHAAELYPTLRRSDKVDVRRLGKVSEDERSVLRIEWRAGLAGVDEAHSVQDMLDRLRRLEAGISEVSLLIRNMPVRKPAAVAAPVAAEVPDTSELDWRLPLANITALVLVALWWFRRRKPVTPAETGPASAPEKILPRATSPKAPPQVAAPLAKAKQQVAAPLARAPLVSTLRADAPPAVPSVAMQLPVAVTPPQPDDKAPRSEPVAPGDGPRAAPEATAEPVATASFDAPETKPPEKFSPNQTMISDFSLEEADPDVVARENAKLLAPPTIRAPKPVPPPQDVHVEPTLQLAEIMLSMGLEQGAAQALTEYIEANPRQAVYHWLKLLGIYRNRGLQKEFTETAEKLRTHFNIQAEEWIRADTSEPPTLEKFSRLSAQVQKIWSQPEECTTYLQHLLEDNREGARAGFPQAVAEEILFLIEILKAGPA